MLKIEQLTVETFTLTATGPELSDEETGCVSGCATGCGFDGSFC